MITEDKSKVKSGKIYEYLTLDAVYGLIPIKLRLHMQRVVSYCEIMTQYIERDIRFLKSIDREFYQHTHEVFRYHDLGYAFVPWELYGTDEEIREHVDLAKEAFERVIYHDFSDFVYKKAMECAIYHHENYDGSGYPKGLKGESIPFAARICAVADSYDHLVIKYPYGRNEGNSEIIKKIAEEPGKQFQPELVEVLINCAGKFRKQDWHNGLCRQEVLQK